MNSYTFNVDDYIQSIENNNEKEIIFNNIAMNYHIHTIFKDLLTNYTFANLSKIAYSYNPKSVLYNVSKINIHIIKQELKIATYLINNINYLDNIDDKDKALALIYVYYYFVLVDFDRIDYVELNSNKGRTIISDYLLDEINEYFDKITENLTILSESSNMRTKELNNEE